MKEVLLNNKKVIFTVLAIVLILGISIIVVNFFLSKDDSELNEIVFNKSGDYNDTKIYDRVVVESDNVNLSNITTNELIISEKVGDGTVKLDNVKVKSELEILGGGPNSVYINNSDITDINIDYNDVRVVVDTKTKVEKIISNNINSLELSGEVENLVINKSASLKILEDSKVNNMEINDNVSLELRSNIQNIKIKNNLDEVIIDTSDSVIIDTIITNTKTTINGKGKLLNVETDNKDNIAGSIELKDVNFVELLVTYMVNFDSNGGSNVLSQKVDDGDKVSKPSNPSREGYTFVSWQYDGKDYNFNTIIESDITLDATWVKNSVDKIIISEKEVVEEIDFDITYIDEKNMKKGIEQVITEGVKGSKTITYEITFNETQNKEVSSEVIDIKVVDPTNKVIKRGISDYNHNEMIHLGEGSGFICEKTEMLGSNGEGCNDNSPNTAAGFEIDHKHYLYSINGVKLSEFIELTYIKYDLLSFDDNGVTKYVNYRQGYYDGIEISEEFCNKYDLACGYW